MKRAQHRRVLVTVGVVVAALVLAPLVLGDPLSLVDVLTTRYTAPDIPPPPLVTLTTPRDGDGVLANAGTHLAGNARATWPGGLVRDVQYRVDDGVWTSIDAPARGALVVPFDVPLPLAPGDHRLEARAADDHGYSAPVGVDVRAGAGAAPPTVRILSPADGEGVVAGDVDVTGTVEGAGSYRVMVTLDGSAPREAQFLSADGRGALWRAPLALAPGLHTIRVQADGDERSVPRQARVSAGAADQPAPTLSILRPEPGEGFGTSGSDACDAPCIAFVGVVTRGAPRGVRVQVDDAPPVDVDEVSVQGDAATWQWHLPVSGMYAGVHRARFVATGLAGESAPRDLTFLLRTTRLLQVDGDTAPRPTGTPLHFRVAGTVRNASWTLDGAPAGDGLATTITLHAPGDHTLVVATSDAQGAGATIRVPLYARDRPPLVTSVGAGTGYAGAPIGVTASATDADGKVVAFRWDFGDGSPLVETTDGGTTHAWTRPGTFALRVAAVDELGAAGESAQRAVVVQDAPPSAAFSLLPQRPSRLDDVRFFDASGDADGAIVSWQWDFGDGATSTERAPVHRFLERGDVTVRLVVVDDGGEVASAERHVQVADLPPTVDFSWTPETPDTGVPVTFTDATTKPDGDLASWHWDFGDGTTSDAATANVSHAFARPGRFAVTLVVTDDVGTRASRTRALDVRDADPLVRAIRIEPETPHAMDPVRFAADATDKEGALDHVAWEFGDNTTTNEFAPTHRYARAGAYDVNLTAFDAAGNRGARSLRVHVLDAPPIVTLTPPDVAYAGFAATLRALATDADGSIARVAFDMDDDGAPECDGVETTCAWAYPSEGAYTARVDVEDDAGIRATARVLVDVLAAPVSLTPPDLVVDSPANGTHASGQLVIAGSARSVRPIRIVEVQLRNESWTLHDAPRPFNAWTPAIGAEDWGFVLDTRAYPPGAYEIAVRATDVGGGAAVARVPILIDNGPPPSELALRVVDLAPMQTVDGTRIVHGSAFHPQGLASVRWRVDDGSWRATEGPHQAFTIPLRARDLPPGAHTLEVEAYRGLGEHNGTRIPFVVPEGRPVLFVDVAPAPMAYGVLHASGHAANDSVVLWRLDHLVWTPLKGNASWDLTSKTTPDDAGEHTLSFKAVSLRTGLESDVITFPVKVLDTTLASVLQESARPAKRDAPGLEVAIALAAVLAIARMRRR